MTGYEQTGIESIYPSNTDIFRAAREQGAIGGYVHPWSQDPEKSQYAVARGFPVDLALGSFEYLEVLTRASHFTNSSKVWHRALNCGFKITASAGEDSILSLHGTPIMGSSRVYAQLGSKLTWDGWVAAIRGGRTFVSNGPLLQFEVDGRIPGDDPLLRRGALNSGQFHSIAPVDRREVYLNGAVIANALLRLVEWRAHSASAFRDQERMDYVSCAISNEHHHPVDDVYVVAETSPVYDGLRLWPIRSKAKDAEYFVRWIDGITRLAQAHPGWRSDRERAHVLDQFAEAKRV